MCDLLCILSPVTFIIAEICTTCHPMLTHAEMIVICL